MGSHPTNTRHSAIRPLLLAVMAAVAFVFSGAVTASTESLPIHGSVAAWADEHPGEPVPLIVQHDGTPDDLLTFVTQSGGTVEREFHIIPALDVEVPATSVDDLARNDDVNWISLDAPVQSTGRGSAGGGSDAGGLATTYPLAVNAPQAWETATGEGITVALVDTGVSGDAKSDFSAGERVQWVSLNPDLPADIDGFGHGTHVGGIIAGESAENNVAGKYVGIAPGASLLSVRIADDEGNATVGDLMAGLEFVDDNRDTYSIRVLNLSVSSSVAQSYTVDPIDAAVELLWLHDVVVVVAAGNDGMAFDAVHYPPANDPFVITVGAVDHGGTAKQADDVTATWSSRGTTQDGFSKPEVSAPGVVIAAPVSATSYLATNYPDAIVEDGKPAYFQMSGTSMSSGVVSGVAALLRQARPEWTPGEIKYVITQTARSLPGGGITKEVLADSVVTYNKALTSADDGLTPSYILLAAAIGSDLDLDDETVIDGIRWRDADFEGIRWRGLELNGIRWRDVDWSGIRWRNVVFSGIRWRGLDFEGIRWRGIRWRAFVED